MLLVVAVIHLLPVIGVQSNARLRRLYGRDFDEPNLAVLMRHRAVMFGVLGGFFGTAAFVPHLQIAALVCATVSAGSFVVVAKLVGGHNAKLQRVVIADLVALACVAVAALAIAMS